MSMLGFAVTATLSLAPPDAGTEAPIIVVTPPPEPAVVVVPAPAPVPTPGTVQQRMVVIPVPPPPVPRTPRKPMPGIGLMTAAVGAFGFGLTSQITTANAQAGYCRNWESNGYNTVHGCFNNTEPWQAHMGTGFAFGSALVMTSIGAGALGQYNAWQTAFGDHKPRNGRSRVVAGGILAMAGIGAIIADGFLLRRELTDFCTTHECEVKRRRLYYALADVGSGAFIAGVGMMSYGKNYKSNSFRYGRNWSLTPQASPSGVGGAATFHF